MRKKQKLKEKDWMYFFENLFPIPISDFKGKEYIYFVFLNVNLI